MKTREHSGIYSHLMLSFTAFSTFFLVQLQISFYSFSIFYKLRSTTTHLFLDAFSFVSSIFRFIISLSRSQVFTISPYLHISADLAVVASCHGNGRVQIPMRLWGFGVVLKLVTLDCFTIPIKFTPRFPDPPPLEFHLKIPADVSVVCSSRIKSLKPSQKKHLCCKRVSM